MAGSLRRSFAARYASVRTGVPSPPWLTTDRADRPRGHEGRVDAVRNTLWRLTPGACRCQAGQHVVLAIAIVEREPIFRSHFPENV